MSDGSEDPRVLELRELRAKRAELRRQREEQAEAEAGSLEAQLEAEQRALREEEALQKAIDAHGAVGKEIEPVATDLGMVIIRRCTALRWKKFQDKDDFSHDAFLALVSPCVLYPSSAELDQMLDKQPAILARLSNTVARLAGVRMADIAKK